MTQVTSRLNPLLIASTVGLAYLFAGATYATQPEKAGEGASLTQESQQASPAPNRQDALHEQAGQHELLFKQVAQWVSEQEGIRPEEVRFLPIDARLDHTQCPQALAIDQPFGSNRSLRVRCEPLKWQVFLRRMDTPEATGSKTSTRYSGAPLQRSESLALRTALGEPLSLPARASFDALVEQEVLVARQNILAKQPLSAEMFKLEKRRVNPSSKNFYTSAEGLEFSDLLRPLKSGEILKPRDLKKSLLVKRGSLVQHALTHLPNMAISAQLQALDDGRIGDSIRLRNPDSGKTVMGRVTGRNLSESL
jgi:flagella basal body P-ring formation protein FlgA